jgi:fucose permease
VFNLLLQFAFLIFIVFLGYFIWILPHERRSLKSGFMSVLTLFSLALFAATVLVNIADLDPHYKDWILPLFVFGLAAVALGVTVFAFTLIIMFLYDGIKIIRKEGNRCTWCRNYG